MYPNFLGIPDSSYTLMILLGVAFAAVIAILYLKRKGVGKSGYIDLIICICFAVALGIVFAVLFENLYEAIAYKNHKFNFKMTFFGGLLGGVIGFLITYYFIHRSGTKLPIKPLVIVAPLCITGAHGFGRIGCFLAGCCYGKHTDSWIGMDFPGLGKVVPTQLIEAMFLFILSGILAYLVFKKEFKYTFIIYLVSYSIFRFCIEFVRDDDRGGFVGGLSPSQIWCIVLFIFSIPLFFYLRNLLKEDTSHE